MNKVLVTIAIACSLSACARSYTPITQVAVTVRGTKDADAVKEIDDFLASKGYRNRVVSSHPGDHKWYEGTGPVFIEIEPNPGHCISFIAYVESGTTEFDAAKAISQKFLAHFREKWSIKPDQVCGKTTNDSLN